MPKITININPYVIEAMLEMIHAVRESLKQHLAVELQDLEDDPELLSAWEDGLKEQLVQDCEQLVLLLQNKRFGAGKLSLDTESAEAVLRGCTAVRIRLQQTLLKDIPQGVMEIGNVEFNNLSPEQQKAYGVYLFLANMQELLLLEIDPTLDEYIS